MLLQELNLFYLKTALWLPPNHHLNLCRQLIYAFIGICAVPEMFAYIKSRYIYALHNLLIVLFFYEKVIMNMFPAHKLCIHSHVNVQLINMQ